MYTGPFLLLLVLILSTIYVGTGLRVPMGSRIPRKSCLLQGSIDEMSITPWSKWLLVYSDNACTGHAVCTFQWLCHRMYETSLLLHVYVLKFS